MWINYLSTGAGFLPSTVAHQNNFHLETNTSRKPTPYTKHPHPDLKIADIGSHNWFWKNICKSQKSTLFIAWGCPPLRNQWQPGPGWYFGDPWAKIWDPWAWKKTHRGPSLSHGNPGCLSFRDPWFQGLFFFISTELDRSSSPKNYPKQPPTMGPFFHCSTWKTSIWSQTSPPDLEFRQSTNPPSPHPSYTHRFWVNASREQLKDVIVYCQSSTPAKKIQVTDGISTVWRFRNPAHQLISHYLQGFIHLRWLGMGFLNHQQYDSQTCPLDVKKLVWKKVTPFPNRWS